MGTLGFPYFLVFNLQKSKNKVMYKIKRYVYMNEKYMLIPEVDSQGVFVCLSEIVILSNNRLAENLTSVIYDANSFLLMEKNKEVVCEIKVNELHKVLLDAAVDINEAAFMIIDMEGQVIKELNILKS